MYNWDGRLQLAFGNAAISLKYDPQGNRVWKKKWISTTERKFIVDIVGQLPTILLELEKDAEDKFTVIKKTYIYVYPPGRGNSQILAQHDGDCSAAKYFYLHDRLGSVRLVIDGNADVKNRYLYNPFGEMFATECTETIENPFKFTGQWFDSEIGKYYLHARMYDPGLGIFNSRDLIQGEFERPLSLHKYLYCENEPVNRLDPTGLWIKDIHNELLQAKFLGWVPDIFMYALEMGSLEADSWKYQDVPHAYMHAMRAGAVKRGQREQTPEEAQQLMFGFMTQKYVDYRSFLSAGRAADAYFALGMAMHPIMDFTDPLHEGFQKWSGGTIELIRHGMHEPDSIDPSTRQWTIDLMNQTLADMEIAYELFQLWQLSK